MTEYATSGLPFPAFTGLSRVQPDCIYYSTLIVWIGCHADSHEYTRWFGDDIAVRTYPRPAHLTPREIEVLPDGCHRGLQQGHRHGTGDQ